MHTQTPTNICMYIQVKTNNEQKINEINTAMW